MWNVFNHILTVLCFVDLVVILSNLPISLRTLIPSYLSSPYPHWSDCICHIAVSSSSFLTVAITIERYLAVCYPINYQIRMTKWTRGSTMAKYLVPAFILSVSLNIPKILNVVGFLSEDKFDPEYQEMYFKVAISSQIIHPLCTTCIIPIIVLCLLNWQIIRGTKRLHSGSLDSSLHKTMTALVVVFIILNIPKAVLLFLEVSTIPNILECHRRKCAYEISELRWLADRIIRFVVLLNSSLNFIIYCFSGPSFQVKSLFL